MSIEDLEVAARRRAGLAIENTHKEFTKKGGLRDLQQQIEVAEGKCSKHIYNLARFAFETDEVDPAQVFADLCAYAEEQYKARHDVENVKDALPVWAVYKSNINRGIRQELDPREHDTEWEFRKATMEQLRESSGNGGERAPRQPSAPAEPEKPAPVSAERVDDWIETTTITPGLKVLVSRLVIEANYVKKGKEKQAEAILREAIGALSKLLDRRKITDDATKSALEAA